MTTPRFPSMGKSGSTSASAPNPRVSADEKENQKEDVDPDPYATKIDAVATKVEDIKLMLKGQLGEALKEMKEGNKHSKIRTDCAERLVEVLEISEKRFANMLSEIRTQNDLIQKEVNLKMEDSKNSSLSMRQFINHSPCLQESEMTLALAKIVSGEVVVTSYNLFKEKKTIGDVDGMVFARYDNEDVIFIMEVKSFLLSGGNCQDAMYQLKKTSQFYSELVEGHPKKFSDSHGDQGMYRAYVDLRVEQNKSRRIRYAFGAMTFGDPAKKYFGKLKTEPVCVVGQWDGKYARLALHE